MSCDTVCKNAADYFCISKCDCDGSCDTSAGDVAVVVLPLVCFAVCLFLLYALMPLVIAKIGAMAVNLNLLSADFYALLLGLFFFQYKVSLGISLYTFLLICLALALCNKF